MDAWAGIGKVQKKLIRKRIEDSRRAYSRAQQRVELLIRNPQFLAQLQIIRKFKAPSETGQPEIDNFLKSVGDEMSGPILEGFCDWWDIEKKWDAEISSLVKHVKTEPRLLQFIRNTDNFSEIQYFLDPRNPNCLLIKIDPWTTLDDITKIWRRVQELQKSVYGFSEKAKWNFGDALCWYDLNRKYMLSLGKITVLWIQMRAKHITDIQSFRITVREGIKRIDRYIARLTPPSKEPWGLEITD